jgi:hypothetical protein
MTGGYDVGHNIEVISSVLGVLQLTNDHGSRSERGKPFSPTGINGEEWQELYGPLLRACIVHLEGMLYASQMAQKRESTTHDNSKS